MIKFEWVGFWSRNPDIEMIRKDGKIYALSGWNGEEYRNCWECIGARNLDIGEKCTMRPICEETPDGDFETVDFEMDTYFP